MRSALIAIVLVCGLLTGCGDSPEHKLSLANQFIKAGQPDKALEMAQAVLNAEIKNEKANEMKDQARFIKAQAHLALNQLKQSRDVLEEIKQAKPDDPEPVRSLIVWAKKSMSLAAGKTEFHSDAGLLKQFEDALSLGESQADTLATRHKLYVESEYVRADLIMMDVRRYESHLKFEQSKLERMRSVDDNTSSVDVSNAAIQRDQRIIDRRKKEVEEHLANVLKEQPTHVEAAGLYLSLMTVPERAGWKEVLDLAIPMSQGKELPAPLAQQVTMAVLRVPDSVLKEKKLDKFELSDKLLSLVPPAEQKSAPYLLTRAHQTLTRGQKGAAAAAQVFLDDIQPTDNATMMEKNFLTAWCLFQQQKFERARLILDTMETQASGSPQVLTLHAQVLLELGETVRSGEQIRRALDLDGGYVPAQVLQLEIIARTNQHASLENQAKNTLNKNPADPIANRMVINQFIANNQKKELEAHLLKVERLQPLREEHMALLIDGYTFLGRPEKTIVYATKLKDARPDQFATHLKYAEALMANNRPQEATAYLDSIKARFPEAGTGDLVLAQLRLSQQQLPEALMLFTRYVALNPRNVEAKLGLARTLASMEKIEDAKKQLQDVLVLEPANQQANAILARIELFLGDTDAAGKYLAQIDEAEVDEASNPALKAQILIQKDELEKARNVCNGAVVRGNNDPVLRLLLARIYTIEKKPADAEVHLLALAYAQPKNLQVYRLLGEFYEANKDLQTVGINKLKELQKVNDTYARLALSGVLESQGKPDEALYALTEIMPSLLQKKDPAAFEVANGIARIHLRRKEIDQARDVFKGLLDNGIMVKESRLRQIDLTWGTPSVHYTMTQLVELAKDLKPEDELSRSQVIARLAKLDKREQALVVIDEWIKASPSDATLWRWKGEMLGQMGRYMDSIQALKEAIGRDPKKLGLHARLVAAHLQNYDFPAAEKALEGLGAVDAKAKALSLAELGQVYVRLGLHRQAAKTFDELEKLGKVSEPTIMFAMGKAHAAIGVNDKARERLAMVPSFARLYPAAQVELARLEMKGNLENQARERINGLINDARTRSRCMTELLTLNPYDRQSGPLDSKLMGFADETLRTNASYVDLIPRPLQSQWMRIRVILLDRSAKANEDYEKLLAALDDWQRMEPTSIQIFKGRIAVLARLEQQPKARQLFRSVPQLAATAQGPLLAVVVGLEPQKVDQRAPLPEYFVSLATGKPLQAKAAAEALETRTAIYKKDLLSVIDRKDVTSPVMMAAARQMATAVVALDAGLPHLSASLSQNVIKVLADLVPAYSLMAQAQLSQGMSVEETLKGARAAIANAGITYYLSAETKIDAGDFGGASADLVRLLETEPDNIHATYRLTQVYQLAGQHELSIQLLEKMHNGGAGSYRVMVANDLAYLLAAHAPKDRLDEAHGIAKRAQELVEGQGGNALGAAALLDTVGWIELMKGNSATAINHLCRAVVALNDRPEVHYHVGVAYDKQGNREWAKYHLEQAAAGDKKLTEVTQAKELLAKWGS